MSIGMAVALSAVIDMEKESAARKGLCEAGTGVAIAALWAA
jgi:hypothetical protein